MFGDKGNVRVYSITADCSRDGGDTCLKRPIKKSPTFVILGIVSYARTHRSVHRAYWRPIHPGKTICVTIPKNTIGPLLHC